MATTPFSQVLAIGQSGVATARVTCTDALGSAATADINISLENPGNV